MYGVPVALTGGIIILCVIFCVLIGDVGILFEVPVVLTGVVVILCVCICCADW